MARTTKNTKKAPAPATPAPEATKEAHLDPGQFADMDDANLQQLARDMGLDPAAYADREALIAAIAAEPVIPGPRRARRQPAPLRRARNSPRSSPTPSRGRIPPRARRASRTPRRARRKAMATRGPRSRYPSQRGPSPSGQRSPPPSPSSAGPSSARRRWSGRSPPWTRGPPSPWSPSRETTPDWPTASTLRQSCWSDTGQQEVEKRVRNAPASFLPLSGPQTARVGLLVPVG